MPTFYLIFFHLQVATPIGPEFYAPPLGPEATNTDAALYWRWCPEAQSQRPLCPEDTWSMGYQAPSPAPHETEIAREIGPLPDPIPVYGPFTAPENVAGPNARSWERNLFYPPGHPGWQPWFPRVLARLFDRTRGPAPPEGAILNTGTTGPSWFAWPGPTGTYSAPSETSAESN